MRAGVIYRVYGPGQFMVWGTNREYGPPPPDRMHARKGWHLWFEKLIAGGQLIHSIEFTTMQFGKRDVPNVTNALSKS